MVPHTLASGSLAPEWTARRCTFAFPQKFRGEVRSEQIP